MKKIKQIANKYSHYEGFDVNGFTKEILAEVDKLACQRELMYTTFRLATDNFESKNVLAEGEVALNNFRKELKEHFEL